MNSTAKALRKAIQEKKAKVTILGLGYVGLPLALAFAKKGFPVEGVDIDTDRVSRIQEGRSYVEDVTSQEIRNALRRGLFKAVENFDALSQADVILICVPTPLNRVRDPDLSHILQATEAIRDHLRRGQLVILESTTYPGTTDEIILPILERSGLAAGCDFFLCFSPERIDPGNKKFPLTEIPKIVGGVTPSCTHLGVALYQQIIRRIVPVSSARTAEMAKLLENTFRIVNIGLVNELAQVAQPLGINIWEAIDAASTKPFGFMPFYPGPGIGGHCIGVDPLYLSWKARIHGLEIDFIELARRINAGMPGFVVKRAVQILNTHSRKAVNGSKILVLGVSYKPNVGDTRESPALEIMDQLKKLGARVSYHDPYVNELNTAAFGLQSQPLAPETLQSQDLVIIATHHQGVDYGRVVKYARLIFDTRNIQHPAFRSRKVVRL